ncbi:AAA family ATPase [Mediterraneibacter massiliensis]|uniref:AAA family ATPase n=1 Tax=Mediterraneibacter massiliensis TaxID=1720300 RepID=UPI0022E3797E|nr:AAA family ATPase [Mediterraneibacter massiliensis]
MSAVDKYEYKLKTEQMLELMEDGAYNKAAEIADTVDWKRVRNVTMLTNVSDIYEKNREYQKSYDVLNIAYHRAEGSRKVVYRLCTLALKTGNVDEAIDYYDDFMQIAPKDPNQHILRYQILRAQRAPIEQQIESLEEFKKAEYIEEWAYELAKLYQEAGMTAECLEECDDLILWFSEGQYVYKAMELKMQYKPLTPSQQEKYDHRYEKLSSETEEIPNIIEYSEKKKQTENAETESEEDSEKPEETMSKADAAEDAEESMTAQTETETKKSKIGNTMRLDEALQKLLHPSEEEEKEDDEMAGLEDAIDEIESVVDLNIVNEIAEEKEAAQEKKERSKPVSVSGTLTELTVDDDFEEEKLTEDGAEEFMAENEIKAVPENTEAEETGLLSNDTEEQIEGQMSFEDIFSDWESQAEHPAPVQKEAQKTAEPILPPDIQRMIDEIEGIIPPEEPKPKRPAREKEEDIPRENMGKLAEELRVDDDAEDFEDFDDILDEDEYEEDILQETDAAANDSEATVEADEFLDDDLEELPADDSEDLLEDDAEEFFDDEVEDTSFEEEADMLADEEDGSFYDSEEEIVEEDSEEDWEEEIVEEDSEEDWEEEIAEEDSEEDWEEEIAEEDSEEDWEDEKTSWEDEFRPDPKYGMEPDDREIPDDDDGEMDILSATTPLSRKETAKMIATGKTAPLPLDEISDALSMSDTGFVVHGRYDLKTQSGIGTRAGLTEEQKKLFSYFVPVRGMSEQLVDVLEQDRNCTNREGTSRTGNLLIIGNKGNGKTVLAVDVVKAVQKQRNIRQGKVAIVTGDSLNKKKISDIFNKLYGGALIIEKAGKMNEKTVARLNKAMERDTGELLIVLEEQRKPLDRLLSSNREFRRKFTSRLEVPIFINDELVTFGQTYAQENGYRIDEMGILALYSRIDSLQREDHAVTVAEVKDVMDEAIQHSQKASAKKLVKRVFGRNTDDADRILLSEKDFNI